MELQPETPAVAATLLARLSNQIVHLTRTRTGRGPTACRTSWAGRDTIVTVVHDWMTISERTLWEDGGGPALLVARRRLDDALAKELQMAAERILERSVATVLTARDCGDNTAAHIFVLAASAHSAKRA